METIVQPQNGLVTEHDHLAIAAASKYRKRARAAGLDPDDLEQAARVGLLKAASRYDPDRGQFAAFARPYVKGEICRLFKCAADDPVTVVDPDVLSASEDRQHTEAQQRDDLAESVHAALETLPADQAAALAAHHGLVDREPRSRRELALRDGVSPSTIRRRLDAAKAAMRAALDDDFA